MFILANILLRVWQYQEHICSHMVQMTKVVTLIGNDNTENAVLYIAFTYQLRVSVTSIDAYGW